ncbi:MAG: hypothetical protein MUE54_11020 [Anaerolineae bacterium]|nr:hypothetical protein [Anaerolineae bacterium]
MRIQRNRSRLSFRTRRKSRMGCTPFSLLLIGVVVVIGQFAHQSTSHAE